MELKALNEKYLSELRKIHEQFYSQEFNFPDFERHFLNAFVVEDDFGKVITAGGIRVITEVIALTDQDVSVKNRSEALNLFLLGCEYSAKRESFDEFHVFVQDENWKKILLRKNFHPTKGSSLIYQF